MITAVIWVVKMILMPAAENIKANIHKFWFMKIPRGSTVYDDGVNVGIGIGIGRRHRGGIGIGW